MFTFGIFSSYIPYAAIAIFYIWYLCFGVSNVAPNENETEEKIYESEILQQTSPNQNHSKTYHYSDYICNKNKSSLHEITYNQSIISWPECIPPDIKTANYGYKLFCRPPPVA